MVFCQQVGFACHLISLSSSFHPPGLSLFTSTASPTPPPPSSLNILPSFLPPPLPSLPPVSGTVASCSSFPQDNVVCLSSNHLRGMKLFTRYPDLHSHEEHSKATALAQNHRAPSQIAVYPPCTLNVQALPKQCAIGQPPKVNENQLFKAFFCAFHFFDKFWSKSFNSSTVRLLPCRADCATIDHRVRLSDLILHNDFEQIQ